MPPTGSGIFISYRRDDAAGEAGRLSDDLQRALGDGAVFLDVAGIQLGRDFRKVINQHVGGCSVLLAVIGPQWATVTAPDGTPRLQQPNDYVRLEISTALQRDIPVIPVLVRGAQLPHPDQLPSDLAEMVYRNSVELSHPRWHSDVALLITALKQLIHETQSEQPDPAPPPPVPHSSQPHRDEWVTPPPPHSPSTPPVPHSSQPHRDEWAAAEAAKAEAQQAAEAQRLRDQQAAEARAAEQARHQAELEAQAAEAKRLRELNEKAAAENRRLQEQAAALAAEAKRLKEIADREQQAHPPINVDDPPARSQSTDTSSPEDELPKTSTSDAAPAASAILKFFASPQFPTIVLISATFLEAGAIYWQHNWLLFWLEYRLIYIVDAMLFGGATSAAALFYVSTRRRWQDGILGLVMSALAVDLALLFHLIQIQYLAKYPVIDWFTEAIVIAFTLFLGRSLLRKVTIARVIGAGVALSLGRSLLNLVVEREILHEGWSPSIASMSADIFAVLSFAAAFFGAKAYGEYKMRNP